MKILKYSFRIYPNQKQTNKLEQFCGAQRWLWNHFLDKEISEYKESKKFNFSHKNITSLPKLKKEFDWLKEIPSTSLQQTLLYMDKSLKQSFKRKESGFPKFKKKRFYQGSFTLAMVSDKLLTDTHFKIPKLGLVKIKLHRKLPSDFKTCQIKQKANKWFVVFTVKKETKNKIKTINKVTGYDLNSKQIVVDSDNISVNNPKFFAKSKQKLKRLNQLLSSKVKYSNNWKKQLLLVQRQHDKIRNQRKDFLHKLSTNIINYNDLICLETLDIKSMQQFNGHMVQDAGWSELISMLEYKCDLYGKYIVKIDKYFPSTKTCSNCSNIVEKNLNERNHKCKKCGLEISRDFNAAINIKQEGLKTFNFRQELPKALPDLKNLISL